MEFLKILISGISLGSVYAIIALGYTMVYGIAKMLNFAHGDVIMVGGYTIFVAMATNLILQSSCLRSFSSLFNIFLTLFMFKRLSLKIVEIKSKKWYNL